MKQLKIALDWTANVNHSGFFIAKELGFYAENELDVDIVVPNVHGYVVGPVQKLEQGSVDFALGPLEGVVGLQTKTTPCNAVAIAAIFTEDITAIATRADSGIVTPKDFDEKIYASYCSGNYGCKIVRQMIKNTGGMGNITIIDPKEFSMWDIIVSRKADFTWIFTNWEGFYARSKGIELKTFKLSDYDIPYGYSPVIMARKEKVSEYQKEYRNFLHATKKGFLFAKNNPKQASDILTPFLPEEDKNLDVLKSQIYTSQYYGDEDNWGVLDIAKVNDYLQWMQAYNIEPTQLEVRDIVTNELL